MHTGERGNQKKQTKKREPSTLTQTTKTRWKGRYTCKVHTPPIFAQLQQLPQQFSSPNIDPNWQKSKKTRGVGWENAHKKLSYESNSLYLAYNIPLRLLYRPPSPPPNHPNFTLCATQQRCTLHQDNNHSKQGRQRPNGGGQKFIFASNSPFLRSFSL